MAETRSKGFEEKEDSHTLPIKSDLPGNRDDTVEVSKGELEVTLKQWNGESEVKITPLFHEAGTASTPVDIGRIESRKGTTTAFVKEGVKDGTFDIDFQLDEKPDSNVFSYRIDGAEDLDFWYQGELTQEKIDAGHKCPENVIGSYAVYHRHKKNSKAGETNYGTGKLFHIYRPKVVDANNQEAWAELLYEDSILSVTVPQKFLDTATYPVIVDPTFGYTSLGALSVSGLSGQCVGMLFSPRLAATGDTVTSYSVGAAHPIGSGTVNVAAYTFTTVPVTRLTAARQITVDNTTPQFFNSSPVSDALSAGTSYTTAIDVDDNDIEVYYDTSGVNSVSFSFVAALAATWVSNSLNTDRYSIYATYTAAAAGNEWYIALV